ncbi:hypothetical protein K438DRAFT_1801129 [Mycena galopus ATCC 62051]|nr:hypothetical protein K438DRAFT_1801129 [Mycena galopus ATCC 62051]
MSPSTQDTSDKLMSRMRAHKGNVPSLPQTKYCSLCPAKFTRTTHLNRHLRSHTNERLHRCTLCKSSEFTRSDLLTRHMRTCGQRVNRSRRKCCEACAESKIKCNLEYPCAKCVSRGRECVFQNDPQESRNKSLKAFRKSSQCSTSTETSRSSTPPPSPKNPSPPPEDSSRTASSCSPSSHLLSLPDLSESGTSSDSSIHSSPRSENFQTFDEPPFRYAFEVGAYCDDPLGPTLSAFDQSLFPSPTPALDAASGASSPFVAGIDQEMEMFSSLIRSPEPAAPSPSGTAATTSGGDVLMSQPTVTLDYLDPLDMQCLFGAPTATMDMYLHLFFTRFLAQVPIIHAPTWKMADTLPVLTRIFHACGALFVKTAEAAAFVETTIASVTAEISEEFRTVNDTSDSDTNVFPHHIHLIIALVLLQTISLFQRQEGAHVPPNAPHHAMLVAMIRQTGLIQRVGSWTAPDCTDPVELKLAWIEWAQFATIKRTLLLAYFHDCSHCMYSASPPSFSPAELNVPLPCDDALWRAPSPAEWYAAAHMPSPYGVGIPRIYGVSMQDALTLLATPPGVNPGDLDARLPLTSFGLFILIHTILQKISVAQRRATPPGGWSCFTQTQVAAELGGAGAGGNADFTFRTQVVLDNWLQIWLKTPEAATQSNGVAQSDKAPFVCNSLPFYWLAQVTLWENSWSGPAFIDIGSFNSDSNQHHPQATLESC